MDTEHIPGMVDMRGGSGPIIQCARPEGHDGNCVFDRVTNTPIGVRCQATGRPSPGRPLEGYVSFPK